MPGKEGQHTPKKITEIQAEISAQRSEKSEPGPKYPELKGVAREIFMHDHSPRDEDCNPGCGRYELGKQLTTYDPAKKKSVPVV